MPVIRTRPPETPFTLRRCRHALALTQASFAKQLGVSLETYRTWDSGRRPVHTEILTLANGLALRADPHILLPLETLASLIHVHRRTLQAAARDGRLQVTYDTRTTFRRLRARATLADAERFRHAYFDTATWPKCRPTPLAWTQVPSDYGDQIRTIRQRLGLTLADFAALVGAAGKAVVYQWESRKRCPSPLFWKRIQQIGNADSPTLTAPAT